MKKVNKILVAIFAIVLTMASAVMLVGCKETKYTFLKTESNIMDTAMYDLLYKDSELIVGNKIKLVMADTTNKMTYKKEGDKYILAGDYVKQMVDTMKVGMPAGIDLQVEMYGMETEDGFDIVIEVIIADNTASVTLKYIKE